MATKKRKDPKVWTGKETIRKEYNKA